MHIWCASLERPQQVITTFATLLSPDENAHAGRFHFDRDRNHFILARGLLRVLLGNYLNVAPTQIEFVYGPQGKPALGVGYSDGILQFNISHSKNLAVYAFNWNRHVGIDVEFMREMPDEDDFARRFFSSRESALVESLSGDQKKNAFFKIWTCKEAILKASGDGLTKPMDETEVTLGVDGAFHLSAIDGDSEQASHWHLETFEPAVGYQGAFAVEGHDWRPAFRDADHFFLP